MEKPNSENDQKRISTPGMMEFLKEVAFLRIITSPWLTETQMTSRPKMLKTKNLPDTLQTASTLQTPSRNLHLPDQTPFRHTPDTLKTPSRHTTVYRHLPDTFQTSSRVE